MVDIAVVAGFPPGTFLIPVYAMFWLCVYVYGSLAFLRVLDWLSTRRVKTDSGND